MKQAKLRFQKFVAGTWLVLQTLALLVILFTPLWIRPGGGALSERFRKTPSLDSSTAGERQPTSITSRVIPIPGADFRKSLSQMPPEWSEEIDSEARQIRFEWTLVHASPDEWQLQSIERRVSGGKWEEVSLVSNENGIPIGSVYVELGQGENIFTAQVVNPKTKLTKRLRLKIAQKR